MTSADRNDHVIETPGPSRLIDIYLRSRLDLLRFFSLRLSSPAAAEDLVQDLYVKLKGTDDPADVRDPLSYLYRMGSNLMLDQMRHRRRALVRDYAWQGGESDAPGVDPSPSPEREAASRQQVAAVVEALRDLSPRCQEAFRLHKLEGLSHAETAERMGVTRSAVEKQISAALKHLLGKLR